LGGIHCAARSLAIELAAQNVNVNAVASPIINTSSHAGGTLDSFEAVAPGGTIDTTADGFDEPPQCSAACASVASSRKDA
jgi:NAD(P)-dependent dehydrogenase (short-subunit alcohol dehydrogenase family)